jgi:hypothetical protein
MKIKLSTDWPYQLLFLIALISSYIDIYEITLSTWLIVLFITIRRYYSKSFLIYCSFFAAIVILGLTRSFFYQHNLFNIIRDLSYFIKPIIGLLIGYQCFRSKDNNFFITIIYCSLIIALIHLTILSYAFIFHHIQYISQVRYFGGYFSDFETFALVILIFHKKFNLKLPVKTRLILLSIIGFSLFMYFARTNLIQFIVISCGLLGLYQLSKTKIIVLLCVILFSGIGYKIIYDLNPSRGATGIENFLYKIKNAPREIYDPYVINDNSPRFHDNFRSYETKITLLQTLANNDLSVWLGNGFGATVNYGRYIGTNEGTQVKNAPILHNGYTTIFLKTGITGLIIYFISLFYLFFYGTKSNNKYQNNIKLLINSTGLFMFISTLVFLGFYLKLDNKSLFVGGLLAYYHQIKNMN